MRLVAWTCRKACEIHVILNLLALLALGQLLFGDTQLIAGRIYLAAMAPLAAAVAVWTIARSQHQGSVEKEFAALYRVPPSCELIFDNGWWIVEPAEDGTTGGSAENRDRAGQQSS